MLALAVIPARGGSKSIPGKNLALVAGRPLITWTIAAALACRELDRVIVSTDDRQIAAEAGRAGAEVPFLRPAELAADDTPTAPVIRHALQAIAGGQPPDWVVVLQPTSPLRRADDISAALNLARERSAGSVVSVTHAADHPALAKRMDPDGRLRDFFVHPPVERRQDLEPAFVPNGAVYVVRGDLFARSGNLYEEPVIGYLMPRERSLDIDNLEDLLLATKALDE